MANEVFISYSRKDFAKVREVKNSLDRELGIDCWMDLDGIESGAQFEDVIIDAICRHDTFLFMKSAHSMQSEWALDELDYAKHENKRIVFVHLDDSEMIGKFYFRYHKYDQIVWSESIQRVKLIRDLRKWISQKTNKKEESEKNTKTLEETQGKEPHVLLHPIIGADGLYGYVDDSGKMVIKPKWRDADYFSEGLASVTEDNDLYGYIDETGAMIIKPQWIEANPFSEGLAAVKILRTADNGFEYDQYGYINHTGKYVIPPNWNEAGDFYEGYACVKRGELYGGRGGFIDKTGRLAIPAIENWKDWKDVSEGMMRVCDVRNRWGFVNTKGEQVIPFKWKNARAFSEGLAAVQNDKDEWCFIDKKGSVKIPTNNQWKEVGYFRCGLARVMKSTCRYDEEWGYINIKGELVIDFQWLEAMDFDQGVARVKTTSLWRLINTKGEFVDSLPG